MSYLVKENGYAVRLCCITGVLLAFTVLLTACGDSSEPDPGQRMAQARDFVATGMWRPAMTEAKAVLVSDADEFQAEARWLLGKSYLAVGEMASAEKELDRASRLGWPAEQVLPALAQSLAVQEKYVALELLFTEGLSTGARATVMAAQVAAALGQGDTWEAQALVDDALRLAPDSVDVRLAQADVQTVMDNYDGALLTLDGLLEAAPEHRRAWRMKGDLLSAQESSEEAVAAYTQAIQLASAGGALERVKRALVNLEQDNLEAAREDGQWLLKQSAKDPGGNYILGLIQLQEQDYAAAITSLSHVESASNEYPLFLYYLGVAHFAQGNVIQARVLAERVVQVLPGFTPGRSLLASIYLREGLGADVVRVLQPVVDRYPDDVAAMNILANGLLLEGRTDEALELLARTVQLQPDSADARFRLGAGLIAAGRASAGSAYMEEVLVQDPQYQQADILRIMDLQQQGDDTAALEAANEYVQRNPEAALAYSMLGRVQLDADNPAAASEAFEQALALQPGDPASLHALAQLALRAGDRATARGHYQTILEHRENYLPAQLELALIDADEGKVQQMEKRLQQAIALHPQALPPRLMLGRHYLREGETDRVMPLLNDLGELQAKSPEVLHLQALVQLRQGKTAEAVFTLGQLVKVAPEVPLSHHLLATALAENGDIDRARRTWQKVLQMDDSYVPSMISLARLAWVEGDRSGFDRYLARLVVLSPETVDVQRMQASAAQRDGDNESAIAFAEAAFASLPNTDTLLELAGIHFLAGEQEQALGLVEQWVEKNPRDVRARLALASNLIAAGDKAAGLAQYREILVLDEHNLTALNNLAWYLRNTEPEQALDYAERAVEASPRHAQALDTLAVVQHIAGDNERAYRSIQRAREIAPDNPVMLYHQAQIEAALERKKAALKTLNALLSSGVDFPDRAAAQALHASLRG